MPYGFTASVSHSVAMRRCSCVWSISVSYTHLDVYKRQVKSRGEDCRRLLMAGGRWDLEQLLSDYRQRELRDFLPAETARCV